jgi:hypothetical protein
MYGLYVLRIPTLSHISSTWRFPRVLGNMNAPSRSVYSIVKIYMNI